MVKIILAFTIDHYYMLQAIQLVLQLIGQLFMIKIAERFRYNKNFGFTMSEHEFQLTLTEDRHEWIEYCTDTTTSQVKQGKFPPVRQLTRHHVTFFNTQLFQTQRNFIGHVPKLLIAKALFSLILDLNAYQRCFVRILFYGTT